MVNYSALKNKQSELIRKSLEGSAFLAPVTAAPIAKLTTSTSAVTASAAQRDGTAAAGAIVTGGNLVIAIDAFSNLTIALASSDTASAVVTKMNTALSTTATASLATGVLRVVSSTTGASSQVEVVAGTGSVLADLAYPVGVTNGVSAAGAATSGLTPLPALYDDLGWLSTDGVSFARAVAQAEVGSWGSVTPTRTDITSDSSTATVVCQETKLLTIGLATGADLAAVVADFGTGEVNIAKPARPSAKSYRLLTLAVDQGDAGEIYIARFFPRAKVTNYAEQSFSGGDDPISWGVTFTGEEDSDLGYSERWIFGGPGWLALLADMGITQATA